MKKYLSILLMIALLLCAVSAYAQEGVVDVTAGAEVTTVYNKITTVIIEYDEEVQPMKAEDFYLIDYRTANMKEDYDRCPFGEGVITAIYTNDTAARREDKTSVPGKYMVLELVDEFSSYYNEEEGLWKTSNPFGSIAGRKVGEKSAHLFFNDDYSEIVMVQLRDAVNANGEVVAEAGILPSLTFDKIDNPVYQDFKLANIDTERSYNAYFSYWLPEDYDPSKTYPLFVYTCGAGGRLNYDDMAPDGSLPMQGSFQRDSTPFRAIEYMKHDVIMLCPQVWMNAPWEDQDDVADIIDMVEYMKSSFSIDAERVYSMASSMGTMLNSQVIQRRPDLYAAYCQCNGCWMIVNEDGSTSRMMALSEENGAPTVGWDKEQYWAHLEANKLDPATYIDAAKAALSGAIENGMKIYFIHAVNDETFSCVTATTPYDVACQMYAEAGKTEEEIKDLVQLRLIEDEEYHAVGVNELHESHRIAAYDDVVFEFLTK